MADAVVATPQLVSHDSLSLKTASLSTFCQAAAISFDPATSIRDIVGKLLGTENIQRLRLPRAIERLSSAAHTDDEQSIICYYETALGFIIREAHLLFAPANKTARISVNGDGLEASSCRLDVDWPEDGTLSVSTTVGIGSGNVASTLCIVSQTKDAARSPQPTTLPRILDHICLQHDPPIPVPDLKTLTSPRTLSLLFTGTTLEAAEIYLKSRLPPILTEKGLLGLAVDPERCIITAGLSPKKQIAVSKAKLVMDASHLDSIGTSQAITIAGLDMKYSDIYMTIEGGPLTHLEDTHFRFIADVSIASSVWHSTIHVSPVAISEDQLTAPLTWTFTAEPPAPISSVLEFWGTHGRSIQVANFDRVPFCASSLLSDLVTTNAGFVLSLPVNKRPQLSVSTIFADFPLNGNVEWQKLLPSNISLAPGNKVDTAQIEIRNPWEPGRVTVAISIGIGISVQVAGKRDPIFIKAKLVAESVSSNGKISHQLIVMGEEDKHNETGYTVPQLMQFLGLGDNVERLLENYPDIESTLPQLRFRGLAVALQGAVEEAKPLTMGELTLDAALPTLRVMDGIDIIHSQIKLVQSASSMRWEYNVAGFMNVLQRRTSCTARIPRGRAPGFVDIRSFDLFRPATQDVLKQFNLVLPAWPDLAFREATTRGFQEGWLEDLRIRLETSETSITKISSYRASVFPKRDHAIALGPLKLVRIYADVRCTCSTGQDRESELDLQGSIEGSLAKRVIVSYASLTRKLTSRVQADNPFPCADMAKSFWPEERTDTPLWKFVEKNFRIKLANTSIDASTMGALGFSAPLQDNGSFNLDMLIVKNLELVSDPSKGVPVTLSSLMLAGVTTFSGESWKARVRLSSADVSVNGRISVSILASDDKSHLSLAMMVDMLCWPKPLALPSLPPNTKDPDFMNLAVQNVNGTALPASSGNALELQSLMVAVQLAASCPFPGDGDITLQNLRLEVHYTRSGKSTPTETLLRASISISGSPEGPVMDLEYRDNKFLLPGFSSPQRRELKDVDIAKAMRETSLSVHSECGELFDMKFDQAVTVRLSWQASLASATMSAFVVEVYVSFEVLIAAQKTGIEVTPPGALLKLEMAGEVFSIETVVEHVSKSLPEASDLARGLATSLLEHPKLANRLISVMEASDWHAKCLLSLFCRGIVPENVWTAVSGHLDTSVSDSTKWLQDLEKTVSDVSAYNPFAYALKVFGQVVTRKLEFAKTSNATLEGLDKAIVTHRTQGGVGDNDVLQSYLNGYAKLKQSHETTLRKADVQIDRLRAMIRGRIILHGTFTPKVRFSPTDGFVRIAWSGYFHTDIVYSSLAWEFLVNTTDTVVPDNDAFDQSSLPGYGSQQGGKGHVEVQREDLKGAKEVFVWARVKYTPEYEWGKGCFISANWNSGDIFLIDDAARDRFKAAWTLEPEVLKALLIGSEVRVDWTAAIPNPAPKVSEYEAWGGVVWEITISSASDAFDSAGSFRWTEVATWYSKTSVKKVIPEFNDTPTVFVRVRAMLQTGTPGSFASIEAPATVGKRARRKPGNTLGPGESLIMGEYLSNISDGGKFKAQLICQNDNKVVLYHTTAQRNRVVWSSGDRGVLERATMQEDGVFILADKEDKTYWFWDIKMNQPAPAGSSLVLQDDGNAVVRGPDGNVYWSTGATKILDNAEPDRLQFGEVLFVGEKLVSPNKRYSMVLQDDGNFVIYDGSRETWATDKWGGATRAEVLEDDNFMVYGSNYNWKNWETGTKRREKGGRGAMILRDDGQAVLVSEGVIIWSTNPSLMQPFEPVDLKPAQPGSNSLRPGEFLAEGQSLTSSNEQYKMTLQPDGNLALFRSSSNAVGDICLWTSKTASNKVTRLCFSRYPPKLILYAEGAQPHWVPTQRQELAKDTILFVGDDGNISLLAEKDNPYDYHYDFFRIWSSHTSLPATRGPISALAINQKITSDQHLTSPNGKFELSFTNAGQLVITLAGAATPIFTQTAYTPSSAAEAPRTLTVTSDRQLQLRDGTGTARWSDGIARGEKVTHLVLTDTGGAHLTGNPGNPSAIRWALYPQDVGPRLKAPSSLSVNQRLVSANGNYVFVLQGDGNLVLYNLKPNMQALWASKTTREQSDRLTMQDDGNLVLYERCWGEAVWSSGTVVQGTRERVVELTDEGNVIMSEGGGVVWKLR